MLLLYPGEYECELHGMIVTLDIVEAGNYRAVSYVCGDDFQAVHRLITPDGTLVIKDSLYRALRRLRRQEGPIVLWVDAICINQQDLVEKARSILSMPRIFQRASCTFAFLGDDANADGAVECLMQVTANKFGLSKLKRWPEKLPLCPKSWKKRAVPPPRDALWTQIKAFFARPWFRRSWIVQEATAAPTIKIVCGKYIVDWNDVSCAVGILCADLETRGSDVSAFDPFLKLASLREWESRNKRWPLFKLLETFRHTKSTRQRDRFFSLLGIASDGDLANFAPDYQCSFETIVFRYAQTFFRPITQNRDPMELLYRAGLGNHAHRFPSWVPDWTIERPTPLADSDERGTYFSAWESESPSIRLLPGAHEIEIASIVIDTVDTVGITTNEPKQHESFFGERDGLLNNLKGVYPDEDLEDMKWQIPIAGATDPDVVRNEIAMEVSYQAFRKILRRAKYRKKERRDLQAEPSSQAGRPGSQISLQEKSENYRALLGGTVQGWRIVQTAHHRLSGLAPRNVEFKDVIAIFKGGNVPFILRKSKERPGLYRLIGECYIHGIMFGEGLTLQGVESSILRIY